MRSKSGRFAGVVLAAVLLLGLFAAPALACNESPCLCPPCPPPTCDGVGTPGYWKNHPEAWPVSLIDVGGVLYTKEQAIAIMQQEPQDKTYTIFRALIAAQLNVEAGCDKAPIWGTVLSASSWLCKNPLGSGVTGSSDAWKLGEPYYLCLDAYNNGLMGVASRD